MADTGYQTPVGKIVARGTPGDVVEKNVETVANVYPGRLVAKGTTDFDIKVADGVFATPIGFAGYEHTSLVYRKEAVTTIQTVLDKIAVLRGGGFAVRASMPKGFVAREGDTMFSWSDGKVVPGQYIDGRPAIAIPFSKNATEVDTNIDLAQYMVVSGCRILVETLVGSGTIDVGIGMGTEAGYDADGFADGVATSAAGLIVPINYNATDASNTIGVLVSTTLKTADGTPLYSRAPDDYQCDGTCISLCYTTSNHTQAGRIFLIMNNPGIIEVGTALETVTSVSAAADITIESKL